jgi:hypothetical protein
MTLKADDRMRTIPSELPKKTLSEPVATHVIFACYNQLVLVSMRERQNTNISEKRLLVICKRHFGDIEEPKCFPLEVSLARWMAIYSIAVERTDVNAMMQAALYIPALAWSHGSRRMIHDLHG